MKFTKEYRSRYGKKVWGLTGRVGGRRVRIFGFETRQDAERAADDLRLQHIEGRYGITPRREPVTLAALVAEYVKDLDTVKNKNHKRKKVVLERFRDHFEEGFFATDLTRADLLSFKRARVAESRLRPNSINRELEAVTAMLNSAGAHFPALESWKPPRAPYERVGERGRERTWSDAERARLLSALRAPRGKGERALAVETRIIVADLVEAALGTGMRLGELLRLRKDYVNAADGLIRLPAHVTKTRRARDVPMNAEVREVVARRSEASRCAYVFTTVKGTTPMGSYQLYRALRKAAEVARVPYGLKAEDGFTFHDARHTATTRMLEAGAPLGAVSEVLGHSKRTMTLRYDHPTLESKRRAVEALAGRNGSKGEGSDNEAAA